MRRHLRLSLLVWGCGIVLVGCEARAGTGEDVREGAEQEKTGEDGAGTEAFETERSDAGTGANVGGRDVEECRKMYIDSDANGSRVLRIRKYDGNGNELRSEWAPDLDYEAERVVIWKYDEDGNKLQKKVEEDDGKVRTLKSWEYDDNGNKVRKVEDGERVTWEYDEDGKKVRSMTTHIGSGREFVTTWKYDDNGNKVRYERDEDADGRADRITTWRYGCPRYTR